MRLIALLLALTLTGCSEEDYFKNAVRTERLARVINSQYMTMTEALNAPRGVHMTLSIPGIQAPAPYFDPKRFAAFKPVSNTPVCVLYAIKGDRVRIEKAWFPDEEEFKKRCGYGKSFTWQDI